MTGPENTSQQAPLVTIGVPVYNGAAMLGDMLASLEAQTFKPFKVVICDNASTDQTPDIAQAFCARDPRFTYHRNPENIGAAPNFNRVWDIDHSTPYYKWAAHDDSYAPTYLERCVEVLEREPDVVISYPITVMKAEMGDSDAPDRLVLRHAVIDAFADEHGRPCWTLGPLALCEGPDPAGRLSEFLNKNANCFEIFGVMRVSALLKTPLHRSYYGSDRALLARLVVIGPFRQVQEPLYINHFHKHASRGMSRAKQRTWIDTKGGVRFRIASMYADILSGPRDAGLPVRDQARCAAVTLGNFATRYTDRLGRKIGRALGLGGAGSPPAGKSGGENRASA